MELRRNYMPPVYNVRRVLEVPLPNLHEEIDIDAELVIQMAINCVDDPNQAENAAENTVENERRNTFEHVPVDDSIGIENEFDHAGANLENNAFDQNAVAAPEAVGHSAIDERNAVDNACANSRENSFENMLDESIDIEHIKMEDAPIAALTDSELRELQALLVDEIDPLEDKIELLEDQLPDGTGETAAFNRSDIPTARNLNIVEPNNNNGCVIPECNKLVKSIVNTVFQHEDDDLIFIGSDNNKIPGPISEPVHNLVKREEDSISGSMAYRIAVCILIINRASAVHTIFMQFK